MADVNTKVGRYYVLGSAWSHGVNVHAEPPLHSSEPYVELVSASNFDALAAERDRLEGEVTALSEYIVTEIGEVSRLRGEVEEKQRIIDGIGQAEALGWAQLESYRQQLSQLQATSEAREAARYRWLRSANPSALIAIAYSVPAACSFGVNDIDAAIDAALQQLPESTTKESP